MGLYYDEMAEAHADAEDSSKPARPGEITDPVMVDAMAEVKRIHAETFGVG